MKGFLLLGFLCVLLLAGMGCSFERAYVLGDVPSQKQLETLDLDQKLAAVSIYMERQPMAETSAEERNQARLESIDTMRGGVAERMMGVTGVHSFEAEGVARIVRVGKIYRLVFSEDFVVPPGPGLLVRVGEVELGSLKQYQGAHTYDLPKSFDVTRVSEVSIYSSMFDLEFARASLY